MGFILLVLAGIVVLFIVRIALRPAVPGNYTSTVKTGGELEARYLANGGYDVEYFEVSVLQDYKKYEIWYPKEMTEGERTYPVIVVSNGTGVKGSKAKAMFEHFASWGFALAIKSNYSASRGLGMQSITEVYNKEGRVA